MKPPSSLAFPEEIAAVLDHAVDAAFDAELDPLSMPAVTVRDVLEGFGVPEILARSLLLSACHAYEGVLRGQRRKWEERDRAMLPEREPEVPAPGPATAHEERTHILGLPGMPLPGAEQNGPSMFDSKAFETLTSGATLGVDPARVPVMHPRLRTLHEQWCQAKAGRDLPALADLDPDTMAEAKPNLWILDVETAADGDLPHFRYRMMGASHVSMFRQDFSGRRLEDVHPDFDTRPGLSDRLCNVVATGRASFRLAVPVMLDANWAQVESLVLPTATDGQRVDALLCMSVWHGLDGREV